MHNRTMLQAFEWYLPEDGLHWKRLKKQIKILKSAGIDLVWLPPAYKGAAGKSSVGYDVYDRYDLGEFQQKGTRETKYGTKEEYLKCIQAFRKNHIAVLTDIVVNHMMGADYPEQVMASECAYGERNQVISEEKEIEVWTGFTFPGRQGAYSTDTWTAEDFNGTDYDHREKRNGLFLFRGKHWNQETDWENGNFDYLMGANLDMDRPETAEKVIRWGKWYMDTTGAEGLRLDAIKHISHDFIPAFLNALREHRGEDFFAVGEYWSGEIERLLNYLDEVGNMYSLFDAPLHYALMTASTSNGENDMRMLLHDSLLKARPENTVTFVDNHDTQPGQALASYVLPWFKQQAYAVILFQRYGLPCIFYGDLFGIPHDQLAPVAGLPLMCRARRSCAHGTQKDYFDDPHVVGYTRAGEGRYKYSGMAVLLTNARGGTRRMYVNVKYKGEEFVDLLHPEHGPVVLDVHGNGEFYVPDGGAAVWVRRSARDYLCRKESEI